MGILIEANGDFFDAFDHVDRADIEGKCLRREVCDGAHVVAPIEDGAEPVEDGRPDADPRHDVAVGNGGVLLDLVVDGVVEEGDETGDANDSERLNGEDAEYNSSKGRGKEGFIDAEEASCVVVHIKRECDGWQ